MADPLVQKTPEELAQLLQHGGADLDSESVQMLIRQLALETVPSRAGGIQEALLQQSRLAAGSPQEIMLQFNEQINGIQSQLQQISRTVARQGGFRMGGQRDVREGQALTKAAVELQKLFGQGVLQGRQGLLDIASQTRPLTALQIPPARESVERKPSDLSGLGGFAADLANKFKEIFPVAGQVPTYPNFGLTSGPPNTLSTSQIRDINNWQLVPSQGLGMGAWAPTAAPTFDMTASTYAAAPTGATTGSLVY
jgi:hypothetical protein